MLGTAPVDDLLWPVGFLSYELGSLDEQTGRLEPIKSPFGYKLSPMS